MDCKKEFASIHLFEIHFLNFVEPSSPHALSRISIVVDESPTNSLLPESTSPLCRGGCMKLWLVQDIEGCLIPRLLSFIFVNLKNTDKGYRSIRSASLIEVINEKS